MLIQGRPHNFPTLPSGKNRVNVLEGSDLLAFWRGLAEDVPVSGTPEKSIFERRAEIMVVTLALIVPVLLTLHPIYIDDLFFHLASGRWMAEHQQIPHLDPFSWTRAGAPWVNFEWLFQIAVYGLQNAAGLNGLIVSFAVAAGIIFWLMARLGRTLELSAVLSALLIPLAALLSRERLAYFRPEFATMGFGVLSLLILEAACQRCCFHKISVLWFFPPLMWIWSNTHGGFVVGLILLMIYAVGAVVQKWYRSRAGVPTLAETAAEWRLVIAVTGASWLACIANPFGISLFTNVFHHLSADISKVLIVEWQPLIGASAATDVVTLWVFKLTLGLGTVGFLLNWRRMNLARLVAWLALAWLAWHGRRFAPLFGLLALPLAASQWKQIWPPRWCLPIQAGAALAGLLALGMIGMTVRENGGLLRLGVDPLVNPIRAVAHLKKQAPHDVRLLNDMNFSVYQIWAWPQQRTFVDLRNVLFGDRFMGDYAEAFTGKAGWERLHKRYDFEAVMLNSHAISNATLIGVLSRDPVWKRVYFDGVAVVFAREPLATEWGRGGVKNPQDLKEVRWWRQWVEENLPREQRQRFREQWGRALVQIGAKESARAELEDLLATGGSSYSAVHLLAVMAIESGDGARAEKYLMELNRLAPDSTDVHYLGANALAHAGQWAAALDEISRVTAANPNDVLALMMQADLSERTGNLERAEQSLRRVVKLYALPRPDPYLRLAAILEKEGKRAEAIQNYHHALSLWGEPDEQYQTIQKHVESLSQPQLK